MKSKTDRRIICLDMNSYFASVEQQDHPSLRGKPIIVTGEEKRTIVVAASREAKLYGIKTGMKIYEAEKLCPFVMRVYGDGDKYASIHDAFISILSKYFLCIEVASIDEVYIDSQGITDWKKLESIAKEIKKDFKSQLGEAITCSIGIAQNKRMAKFASNLHKPDGLTILTQEDISRIIPNTRVEEISGIGRRITKRLHSLGIYTFKELNNFPIEIIKNEFGEYLAIFLYNTAAGIDLEEVVPTKDAPKSFSHEITLPNDLVDRKSCEKVLYGLVQRVAFRMKEKGMKARCIGVHARFTDFTSLYSNRTMEIYTYDPHILFTQSKGIFSSIFTEGSTIRQIGVHTSLLVSEYDLPVDLFSESSSQLQNALQKIKRKYGQTMIAPLSTYYMKNRIERKIHGFYLPEHSDND